LAGSKKYNTGAGKILHNSSFLSNSSNSAIKDINTSNSGSTTTANTISNKVKSKYSSIGPKT
jgi:hypothetical protein